MKKGLWADEEVKSLFQYVEEVKASSAPLKNAFILHAKKYNRKPNSVRNYYYHEIDNLADDEQRAKRLNIDLKNHEKNEINYFSASEESDLMQKIAELVSQGNSVRKACLTLSGGDVDKMLRYQNKYRNYISKKQSSPQNNVIKFTKRKKEILTESDINSLFLGLVRLVKRTAVEELSNKMKEERESQNYLLRKALVDLNKKEKQIQELKNDFIELKAENARLVQNITKLKCDKASLLSCKLKTNQASARENL